MYKYFLLVAFVPALVLGQTPVRQCTNGAGLPEFVDINGCRTLPCQLTNGAPIIAVATGITSPVATPSMDAYIIIRLAGLQIPYSMPDELKNACAVGVSPGTCPVSAGQVFDYSLNIEGETVPLTGVTVQVEVGLRASDNSVIGCLEFDATIVN